MGKNKRKRWNSCLVWFAASLGALSFTLSSLGASAISDGEATQSGFSSRSKQYSACPSVHEEYSKVIIVSTLDGKLSALDGGDNGQLLWSVAVDTRPLLSSSISKLEIMHDGVPTRYIPALDGGLYRYDGESIEALPMTAETLLSSSFKLADNTVMIGGKDTISYGISPLTGKVRYMCSVKGCRMFGESVQNDEDVLVVTRNAQCVRAVDSRTGLEKWNFSVGNHDLQFLAGQSQRITKEWGEMEPDDDDGFVTTCPTQDEEDEMEEVDMTTFARSIKIMVPDGKVVGVSSDNIQMVTWQHKFKSPISNVWLLSRGNMEKIDMFGNDNIPALSGFGPAEEPGAPPLLYIGMHQKQLYVQPSPQMHQKMMETLEIFNIPQSSQCGSSKKPRIAWKPYLNTAQFRTPSLNHNRPQIGQEEKDQCEDPHTGKELTIWHEEYPFDNGFYLYPEFSLAVSLDEEGDEVNYQDNKSSHYEHSLLDDYLPVSLWNWWKEVVAISILTSLVVHLVLSRIQKIHAQRNAITDSSLQSQTNSSSSVIESSQSDPNLASRQNSDETDFVSRYASDFDHIQVLGKGGFGVVFETMNKVDECHYAIKRIALPNNPGAKEKVMREVRALAKLDHIGIVRYFNAWYESPPVGWQEELDKKLEASEGLTSPSALSEYEGRSILSSVPSRLPFETSNVAADDRTNANNNNKNCMPNSPSSPFDALQNPFGQNILDLSETELKRGGSEEFAVHSSSHWSEFDEESGSFSCGTGTPNFSRLKAADYDDSVDIEFAASDSVDKSNIPCSDDIIDIGHRNDSFQVVFEDSGCADRNSKSSNDDVCIGMSSQSHDLLDESCRSSTNQSEASSASHKRSHSRSKSLTKDFFTKLTCINEKENKTNVTSEKEDRKDKGDNAETGCTKRLYLYIQMQLCQRETLKDWLTNNTLNRDRRTVLDMFDQIACAVEYVHECGLMHRDLKPSNIFFSLDGTVKVGDFGLVTALPEEQNEVQFGTGSPFRKHTAQVGTQLYMSIEQASGKLYSKKVDIFSLGVILFELLFPFSTAMERVVTLQKVRKQQFPERFFREMHVECEFVRRLLSPDPNDRPDIGEVLSHDLLKEFATRRIPRRNRTRTISQNSNNSN